MLSDRQQEILTMVIEAHLETGAPIGSKLLAEQPDVAWSASTIRAELSALEVEGFLNHPHTSAGRVPTDSGYRFYADTLVGARRSHPPKRREAELGLTAVQHEVEDAMQKTTAALAQANDLLALVTAPPASTATIHRIEVLALQPKVVVVVAIGSNGDVVKRVFSFREPVDPGLVEWASSFLNERLAGMPVGARSSASKLDDPELGPTERAFLSVIGGALSELGRNEDAQLYMDGTARLLSESHAADIPQPEGVVRALEGRVSVLSILRSALGGGSVFLSIGAENPDPALRGISVVGAGYGLGYRPLGAVGVVGPLRMDYETAIDSVRDAASELSRFFETFYEG